MPKWLKRIKNELKAISDLRPIQQAIIDIGLLPSVQPNETVIGTIDDESKRLYILYAHYRSLFQKKMEKIEPGAINGSAEKILFSSEAGRLKHHADASIEIFWLNLAEMFEKEIAGNDYGIRENWQLVTIPDMDRDESISSIIIGLGICDIQPNKMNH